MGENILLAYFFGINEDQKKILVRRGNLSVASSIALKHSTAAYPDVWSQAISGPTNTFLGV